MAELTTFQDDLLKVVPLWLGEPLRAATDLRTVRPFACNIARAALAHFDVDNDEIQQALLLAECADKSPDPAALFTLASEMLKSKYHAAQDKEAEMRDLFEAGKADLNEVNRACDVAAAYRTLVACLHADPITAATHALYDVSHTFAQLSDADFHRVLEPTLENLK